MEGWAVMMSTWNFNGWISTSSCWSAEGSTGSRSIPSTGDPEAVGALRNLDQRKLHEADLFTVPGVGHHKVTRSKLNERGIRIFAGGVLEGREVSPGLAVFANCQIQRRAQQG